MEWMLMPLKRYADFSGRSRRKEYWMWTLGVVIVYVVLAVLGGAFSGGGEAGLMGGIFGILLLLFWLAILVPAIAVTIRRLHDTDRSGWWILINLIPFGGIVLLVFMCLDGTPGDNQYGPNPKNPVDADTFS